MRDLAGLAAQRPEPLDDLGKSRRKVLDLPPGVLRSHVAGERLVHLPAGRRSRERRLEHFAIQFAADLDVGERELLDGLVLFVEQARLEQQAAGAIGPELVAEEQAVL